MSAFPVTDVIERLGGPGPRVAPARAHDFLIVRAEHDPERTRAVRALRRRAFVERQGLFAGDDADEHDDGPHTRVLVAVSAEGAVIGGVRLHPECEDAGLGWWRGSRLVVEPGAGALRGRVGAALVAAACVAAVDAGALRFDAIVQDTHAAFFRWLGWRSVRPVLLASVPHLLMRWPIDRFEALVAATKAPLGGLLAGLLECGAGWTGDDGVPVPGSSLVASTDAILPSMVERDPEWAGWCGMLVTAHDLGAMGAVPAGALDALGAGDAAHAERVLRGVRAGAEAFALPVLGGHTQLGVPGALSVTGFGWAPRPVAAGGGALDDLLTVTADLDGCWRPGYSGRQWDSSSRRSHEDLSRMLSAVRRARPHAAKDVSMAGIVGTTGMLAEASGCGAELEVAAVPRPPSVGAADWGVPAVPRPPSVGAADWLTCFPGFGMVTAGRADAPPLDAGPAVGARCGRLVSEAGVRLRWPDGELTEAIAGAVTGLGPAAR